SLPSRPSAQDNGLSDLVRDLVLNLGGWLGALDFGDDLPGPGGVLPAHEDLDNGWVAHPPPVRPRGGELAGDPHVDVVLLEGGADELGPRLAELRLAEELVDDDRVPRERRIAPAVGGLARRGLCNEVDLVVGATGDAL